MARPTKRSVLACLTKKRLLELDRGFELGTAQAEPKASFIEGLASSKGASFDNVLSVLSGEELRLICRSHELAVSGTKVELAARIRGRGDSVSVPRTDANEGDSREQPGDQLGLDLADFLARAHPSVRGIVPLLAQTELADVMRRLLERHGVTVDLREIAPGMASLAAALEERTELAVFIAELDRDQLAKVCTRYALRPNATTREGYVRTILAAAAGLTVDEAEEAEGAVEVGAAPVADEPTAAPTDTARYQAAVAAAPRGVLHRIEADLDPGKPPKPGEIVRARHRQYLVTEVVPPPDREHRNARTGLRSNTLVKLVCLDDDAQGRELELFWELELGAERVDPARQGLGVVTHFDDPDKFEAYYRALQWNCVTTATRPDDERVQAPFRAGIAVMQHQLVPLQRVLAMPRANLFIADDVGLGKTIEAGLILQELLLRQRLDLILIVCPASICLQWQGEMEQRFGIRFEIVNREHLAKIRRERGAATNPWDCGRRFIVSYQTLRRPEYQELLLLALDHRGHKSMLVLDEAHNVAPASNLQRYAVDSKLTKLARAIAPKFENRLFLSATPHNGHSNSFSALLELLDPTRFTRGVPISGSEGLDAVMVRRLKRDLIGSTALKFPKRRLVELRLTQEAGQWSLQRAVHGESDPSASRPLCPPESHELELSKVLADYTKLCGPSAKRDRRVFIGLQKRLLSSCAAFQRTLQVHLKKTGLRILEALDDEPPDVGASEDGEIVAAEFDRSLNDAVAGGGALPDAPSERQQAQALLDRMQELVRGASSRPEGKILALIDWVRAHQCPAAGSQWFQTPKSASREWSDTRLIVFTEYSHTAEYIIKMLRAALAGTEREDDRIAYFHGGTPDDSTTSDTSRRSPGRRELQANFNARPDKHPVRILVATDAAREGVNFQAHCADLIHYDIPWNPGRLEQRNGRIDRTLQPSPEVRCMYFAYPQRTEDRVLQVLVEKVERIARELGSLSAVVLDRMEESLEPHGIDDGAQRRLELASDGDAAEDDVAQREIASMRDDPKRLLDEIEAAGECYERSRAFFAPDAEGLRETVGIALGLGGSEMGFERTEEARDPGYPDESEHYRVPEMPRDWGRTLDTLRPPKPRELSWWEWRSQYAPRPVVFEPLRRMTDEVIQLHLEHPLVRRALRRFTAQGHAAHDLSRVSLLQYSGTRERVVVVGRVSLFGAGATRLHDGLLHRIADIRSNGDAKPLSTESEQATALQQMREAMRRPGTIWQPPPDFVTKRLARVDADIAKLWPLLQTQAQDEATELVRLLDDRGAREADRLVGILRAQQSKIRSTLGRDEAAGAGTQESASARQRRLDRDHMQARLQSLEEDLKTEPDKLRRHYAVLTQRIEAVGLIYLVPETR